MSENLNSKDEGGFRLRQIHSFLTPSVENVRRVEAAGQGLRRQNTPPMAFDQIRLVTGTLKLGHGQINGFIGNKCCRRVPSIGSLVHCRRGI
jgi:hypothetical protein